jgi:membrane protein involved in colicin uptake
LSEIETPAPEAGEVVAPEAIVETSTVVSETEGQVESQPAESEDASPETEDQKSKSKERRERRKAEQERLRQSEADANAKLQEAQRQLQQLRDMASKMPQPQQKDFADFESYQAALTAHHMLKATDTRKIAEVEAEARTRAEAVKALDAEKTKAFADTLAMVNEDGMSRYPDYADVVLKDTSVPITPAMVAVMAEAENPGELAYHVAKNRALAARLANMHPVQMAREIGRLEAQLSLPRSNVTTAPAPIAPVTPKAKPVTDPARMSPSQYAAWREKGGTFTR